MAKTKKKENRKVEKAFQNNQKTKLLTNKQIFTYTMA